MKLRLYLSPQVELSGYTNLCLDGVKDYAEAINEAVDDAEVIELVVDNTLEYAPQTETMSLLECMIRKLRHGGTIIFTGVDAYTVAKGFTTYNITVDEFNLALFGIPTPNVPPKAVALTLSGLANYLEQKFGLKIISKSLDRASYVIEAQRQ